MYICRYCGKECKNTNSLRNHERLCKLNPNHQTTPFQTNNPQKINAWNKALSKETSEIIRSKAEKIHLKYLKGELVNHQKGKPRTEEEKRKISATIKKNKNCGGLRLRSGRGKKGKYKGYYCDSTYELVYIIYNIDHNIEFSRCSRDIYYIYEYQGKNYKYYPDFILPDNSLIEIKGYHSSIVDLKLKSVTDRNIKVLYEKDLKYAFDYVKEKYNPNNLEDLYDSEDDSVAAY